MISEEVQYVLLNWEKNKIYFSVETVVDVTLTYLIACPFPISNNLVLQKYTKKVFSMFLLNRKKHVEIIKEEIKIPDVVIQI